MRPRLFLRPALVFALVVCGVSAAGSGEPENQSTREPENPIGLIVGQVVDGVSGQPLAEAVVTLDGPGDVDRRVMVDPDGRFVFTDLVPGQYRITAEKFGYLRGAVGRTSLGGSSLPIDLAESQRVVDASILMWKMASITGRVIDEAGEPMVGIAVAMVPQVNGPALTTDDRGVYRLPMMPPGDYAVVVPARVTTFPVELMHEASDRSALMGAISEVSVLGSRSNVQIGDLVLATISRAPIPPAPLRDGRLSVYQTTFYPSATSRAEASVITLAPGEERVGVDIQMKTVPAFSVSGQLTGPDGPLARTSLSLVAGDGGGDPTATGVTNTAGRFTLLGVPRGQYVLRVQTAYLGGTGTTPDEKATLWATEPVVVGDADVTGLVVAARPTPILTGRVDVTGARQLPPSGFEFIVQAIDPGPLRVVNPRLDAERRFSTQLVPGRYMVLAFAPAGAYCTSVAVAGRPASDEPFEIRNENVTLVIKCGEDPTRIAGTVRDSRGEIDARASVVAFSVDRLHWSGATLRPQRLASARSTASGTFALVNLPPGEYFVSAIPETASSNWKDAKTLDVLARSATRLTLAAGESRTIDLRTVVTR